MRLLFLSLSRPAAVMADLYCGHAYLPASCSARAVLRARVVLGGTVAIGPERPLTLLSPRVIGLHSDEGSHILRNLPLHDLFHNVFLIYFYCFNLYFLAVLRLVLQSGFSGEVAAVTVFFKLTTTK